MIALVLLACEGPARVPVMETGRDALPVTSFEVGPARYEVYRFTDPDNGVTCYWFPGYRESLTCVARSALRPVPEVQRWNEPDPTGSQD